MSRSLLHCFFGGRKRRPTRRGTAPRRSYLPRLHAFEDRVLLNAYTVTTLADSGDGSLRQAILGADQAGGDNTITFAVTGTLNLESALPDLTSNISMQGPGTALLTVQRDTAPGTPAFGILTVSGSFTVTLSGMTIANGSSLYGGGVFNNGGSLTVQDSTLVDNHAWRGGGICNFGTLAVSASTLANNSADNNGEQQRRTITKQEIHGCAMRSASKVPRQRGPLDTRRNLGGLRDTGRPQRLSRG